MLNKTSRPTDPYSPLWHEYNEQNPHLHRSVGADGDNDDTPSVEDLQDQLKEMQSNITNLTSQNETLQADNDKWKEKQAEADKHRKAEERKAAKALEEAARKSGDVEALEKSWNEKYNNTTTELTEKITSLETMLNDATVGTKALTMATELALKPEYIPILQRYIKDDLVMDLADGKPSVKVTQNGKPCALTLDDLKLNVSKNPMFADMIRASSASGAGSASNSGGGDSGTKTMKRADFDNLDHNARGKFMKGGGKLID